MPRLEVNNYLLAGRNADFESTPTFTAAGSTGGGRWIDGTAAGSTALTSQWGWAIINGSTAGTYGASFDNTEKYSGDYSMKLSITATGSALAVGNMKNTSIGDGVRSGIKISPSTAYGYSFAMKTRYVSGSSSTGAALIFSQRTAAGGSTAETASSAGNIQATTDWTVYTGTFTTDSDAHWLLFKLQVSGTGGSANLIMDAWYDDLKFYPVTPVTRTAVS